MKRIFLWIFISYSIFSCNNKATEPEIENYIPHKNVMTGFGKIKIGMSVQDFETNNDALYCGYEYFNGGSYIFLYDWNIVNNTLPDCAPM